MHPQYGYVDADIISFLYLSTKSFMGRGGRSQQNWGDSGPRRDWVMPLLKIQGKIENEINKKQIPNI